MQAQKSTSTSNQSQFSAEQNKLFQLVAQQQVQQTKAAVISPAQFQFPRISSQPIFFVQTEAGPQALVPSTPASQQGFITSSTFTTVNKHTPTMFRQVPSAESQASLLNQRLWAQDPQRVVSRHFGGFRLA